MSDAGEPGPPQRSRMDRVRAGKQHVADRVQDTRERLERTRARSSAVDAAFKTIERDGLTGLYAPYAAQVAIYQAYLDCTNPALFSVVNADTCERLHFTVPFDVELAHIASDRAVMKRH